MKIISLTHIKSVGPTTWKRRRWWSQQKVRIWSNEHRAWWRPDAKGYTTDESQAWVLDFEEAFSRTEHCGPEKKINYCALSREEASLLEGYCG